MTHDPHAHHAPNVKAYLAVFGALIVLTILTVAVAYLRLPIAIAVIVALAIASVKAGLVGAFFMHLKGERLLIFGLLGLCVLFLIYLFGMPLWDLSYHATRTLDPQPNMVETQGQGK